MSDSDSPSSGAPFASSDIGGATHGAYNASATEIFHEGIRIPPLRLVERAQKFLISLLPQPAP